jgi:hypothetical protein
MSSCLWYATEFFSDFSLHRCYASRCIGTEEISALKLSFFETDFTEIPRGERSVIGEGFLCSRANRINKVDDIFLIVSIVFFVDFLYGETYIFIVVFFLERFFSFFEP